MDLGRTSSGSFFGLFTHAVEGQGVFAALPFLFGKRAELAAVDAEVGVVDMPIDVEENPVAILESAPQRWNR